MTRILYGIQGTGNGHLARARALVPALRRAGVHLDFVFTGRARHEYFNMELFEGFQTYPGLSLITNKGQMQTWQTITKNSFSGFLRDLQEIQLQDYDLILSDFEPLTAWASRKHGIESLGISHQCAFNHPVPKVAGHLGSKLLMKCFAPTSMAIGLHWHHFSQPILPPLIESFQKQKTIENKIVVYMGFEDTDEIVRFLRPFNDYHFYVYAKVAEQYSVGSVQVKPLSHQEFHADLSNCSGVISNAGFELSSECLALGKKLFLKPLKGQYEQLSNALAMQTLGRATIVNSLDQAALATWLKLDGHSEVSYPDVAAGIAHWIASGRKESVVELAEFMWSESDFPFDFNKNFGSRLLSELYF